MTSYITKQCKVEVIPVNFYRAETLNNFICRLHQATHTIDGTKIKRWTLYTHQHSSPLITIVTDNGTIEINSADDVYLVVDEEGRVGIITKDALESRFKEYKETTNER